MKYFLFTIILCWTVSFTGVNAKEPVTVILTAGQSNTDGRILNEFYRLIFRQINISIATGCMVVRGNS